MLNGISRRLQEKLCKWNKQRRAYAIQKHDYHNPLSITKDFNLLLYIQSICFIKRIIEENWWENRGDQSQTTIPS